MQAERWIDVNVRLFAAKSFSNYREPKMELSSRVLIVVAIDGGREKRWCVDVFCSG